VYPKMEKVVDIQGKDFDNEINSDKPVAIEFWIKCCGNCKKFKPVYDELLDIFGDRLKFTRVNMFENVENLRLAEGLKVEETPTVKLFYKSEEIGQLVGFKTLEVANEEIENIIKESGCCKE
jgi:thiol-disulfide isomerase/thioredoxin